LYAISGTGTNNLLIGTLLHTSLAAGAVGNTGLGANALASLSTGDFDTVIGYNAAPNLATGSYNTIAGYQAGASLVSGSYNLFLGYYAGQSETGSNKLYIQGKTGGPLIKGDFSSEWVYIYGDLYIPSDSDKLFLGAGDDATIHYDGGDLVLTSDAVGIGDVAVSNELKNDQTIGDGVANAYYACKTLKYTLGWSGHATSDYNFTGGGGSAEEQIQIGGGTIIPAYAIAVNITVVCTETWIETAYAVPNTDEVTWDLGSTAGGNDYKTLVSNVYTAGDVNSDGTWTVSTSARSFYFNAIPSEEWSDQTAGEYTIYITYIDCNGIP
jgi:hypothetical protein